MSIIDLLEKKKAVTFHEWNEVMQERIMKNASSFNENIFYLNNEINYVMTIINIINVYMIMILYIYTN
jgi:hypothetical protein